MNVFVSPDSVLIDLTIIKKRTIPYFSMFSTRLLIPSNSSMHK